jgi:hypothetical protein
MGFLFRLVFLYVPLLAIVGVGCVLAFGIDDRPAVTTRTQLSAEDIARGRLLADRYDLRHMPPGRATPIALSGDELNAILNATMAATDRVRARVELRPFGLVLAATVNLPAAFDPIGRYVNVRAAFPPSPQGFEVARLAVGRIDVPTGLIKPALAFGLDRLMGPGKGQAAIDSIRSVSFANDRVTVVYDPPARLVEELKAAALDAAKTGSPDKVNLYYDAIRRTARRLPPHGTVSLAAFVGAVFQLAKERSLTHDPADENRSALLALAIAFGDARFAQLVGPTVVASVKANPPNGSRVRLQGHEDWVQHFIVSAGLALSGGRQVADLIGVAKEIDDIAHSSGFSFTDLAADRAGTRLARAAIASAAEAHRIQDRLAGEIGEDAFFPAVRDLPEMMTGVAFRARYGDIHDDRYIRMVMEIDRRIDLVPLYR